MSKKGCKGRNVDSDLESRVGVQTEDVPYRDIYINDLTKEHCLRTCGVRNPCTNLCICEVLSPIYEPWEKVEILGGRGLRIKL